MSHNKFGPDRFSRFDVYWIQTNKQSDKQTDRQAKFIYRLKRSKTDLRIFMARRNGKVCIEKNVNSILEFSNLN